MDSHRRGTPWGKLVKVDSSGTEVLLFNRECTIGRKKGCDLAFPANKLVSGEHCKIVQDENSGQVWLEDMSTNGTVINMAKLVKKQTHMLQNGDVIYFVYRKNEPEENIAYVYHAIQTEHGVLQDDQNLSFHDPAVLASSEMMLSVEPVMLTKAPRDINREEPQPSTSTSHLCFEQPFTPGLPSASACLKSGSQSSNVAQTPEKAHNDLEPECKKRKTEIEPSSVIETTSSTGSVMAQAPAEETKTDKMEESLTCIICQDLLYDCVSLQPCMHTFCAACYSGWMERSSFCPTCRCPVERIRKNHILNNLVEAYLIQHPDKCRSEEDVKSMDSRNKITQDILQPKVERCLSDEEGSSDYPFEFSDNDSDSSDISQPLIICRQCPGYRKEVGQRLFATGSNYWLPGLPAPPQVSPPLPPPITPAAEEGSAKSFGEQPSTSSDNPPVPLEYRCHPLGCHLMCSCCLQPMPDRRAELNSQQQCSQCQRPFCHIYWGCQKIGCQGCLARVSELNLTDKCLDGVLNNNSYESEILKNYLSSRGKTWRDLLKETMHDLQQGKFCLSDQSISANTILCVCCGLMVFKELAYKYRQNIPKSELPAAVLSRPDCYWGRNCRTQVKAHHAMKFNHICEQTRFKS
ncbi:E3 ubiquitin-protein ligase CHFR isoform X1 [Hippocampus zosterae]|uniref:E3 ubiquitin-protein ligase CHFR isoform X1 n=1 Tax=Hippocampus zosterae TaxID=109293 RepID=UPI00223DE2BE|nr:E3 ubiquitin-protein ligase CHFR isoform X1 [Hippocampus zosterae]